MLRQLEWIGGLMVALALLHAIFPRYFRWRTELAPLSLMNRQMMQVHTFFIALTVLLMGVLCLTSASELAGTALGRRIALGMGVFWSARLLVQFFWYSPRLWRGKRLETALHLLAVAVWTWFSVVLLGIGLAGNQSSAP